MNETWDGESDPLAALREGRQAPFEAFVEAETRTFLGFFRRLGAGRSEAEDLTQETFLKLFRLAVQSSAASSPAAASTPSPSAYDARGQFRGYAFRVARNVWIDRTRRKAAAPLGAGGERAEAALETAPDEGAEAPAIGLERGEESERIREAVALLPDAQRAVFDLGVVEELPYSEIAAALEIPVGTVKSRMYHAVHRVRAALEGRDRTRAEILRRSGGRA